MHGFKQIIKVAIRTTETSATLIDVIQTTNPQVISATNVIPIAISDHDLIACVRKLNHRTFKPKTIEYRNYKNYTSEAMSEKILNHKDFQHVTSGTDINKSWNKLKYIITSCLDDIALKIIKRVRGKPSPWLSAELKSHMNSRDMLLRKSRKSKNPDDIAVYKKKKKQVNRLVHLAKKKYFQEQLQNSAQDPNSFWNTIKTLYPSKNSSPATTFTINGKLTSDKSEISNTFCTFFSSIIEKMKKQAFILRNCVWIRQSFEPLRTCRKFKFKYVSENTVETELKKLKPKKATGLDCFHRLF